MVPKDCAAIQRNLGVLEGLVCSLPEPQQQMAYGAIEVIDETIDATQKGEGG